MTSLTIRHSLIVIGAAIYFNANALNIEFAIIRKFLLAGIVFLCTCADVSGADSRYKAPLVVDNRLLDEEIRRVLQEKIENKKPDRNYVREFLSEPREALTVGRPLGEFARSFVREGKLKPGELLREPLGELLLQYRCNLG